MRYIRNFNEISKSDVPVVGGKNASLGEMYNALTPKGVKIPNGFAITAEAFRYYLDNNKLTKSVSEALEFINFKDLDSLNQAAKKIRQWILNGEMPKDLVNEIRLAYKYMELEYGQTPDVAVRSSATAEDLATASFAGQQDTYLNIRGVDQLAEACKKVFASLFTNRAISYREDQGFDHIGVAISIGVQKMVRADQGSSGVMFSIDTETGFRDVVFITSAYGLGENVVQGTVNPDEFYVFKPTLATGHRPIIKRQLGRKALKMIYTDESSSGASTKNIEVTDQERRQFSLEDDEVLDLARHAAIIEDHYGFPVDIEWAKEGDTGDIYIVQARPETVKATEDKLIHESFHLDSRGKILTQGKSVGQKIATGKASVILDTAHMSDLQAGDILVTDITTPDWEPVMKTAAAIVTNRGGRTCHAAIIARELGIPAIVGTLDGTDTIINGQEITVSCSEGDTGYVYEDAQQFSTELVDLTDLQKPNTKIMLNLANPEIAFEASRLPVDGVGLARLEFIINNSIGIHPSALLEYEHLPPKLQQQINDITVGYPDPRLFYINRLSEGIGMIAAAFYPRPVIVRTSDFKSNEYASLIGGKAYEPQEENPMIGFRGASRYPAENFADSFALECKAIKEVRETMGLDNVAIMIPFVRSVEEANKVLELMKSQGLERGKKGLKIYLMCEIPANALLADDFLQYFDGFSIGSNDLTQLTLGVDRDSGIMTGFDERNPAVLRLMEMAIKACTAKGKYIGICGQAPSDYPEITQWLVEQGIESISLNPDSVLQMTQVVLDIEQKIKPH
jgi:pyruvate,water dikinase